MVVEVEELPGLDTMREAVSDHVPRFHSHTTPGPPTARCPPGRARREAAGARLRGGTPPPPAPASSSSAQSSPRLSPVFPSHRQTPPPCSPPAATMTCPEGMGMVHRLCMSPTPRGRVPRHRQAASLSLAVASLRGKGRPPRSHACTPPSPADTTLPPGRGARKRTVALGSRTLTRGPCPPSSHRDTKHAPPTYTSPALSGFKHTALMSSGRAVEDRYAPSPVQLSTPPGW